MVQLLKNDYFNLLQMASEVAQKKSPKKEMKEIEFLFEILKKLTYSGCQLVQASKNPNQWQAFACPQPHSPGKVIKYICFVYITGCQLAMDSLKCKSHRPWLGIGTR